MRSKKAHAKRRREREADEESRTPRINPETKKSVIAIVCLGAGLLLILAIFEKVGPVGTAIYEGLVRLVGVGYFILPVVLFLLAITALTNRERRLTSAMFIGALVLVLSVLGFIEIVAEGKGGLVGSFIGVMKVPFGFTGSLVITGIVIIGSLLVTLNANLGFLKTLFARKEMPTKEKEDDVETALQKMNVPTPPTLAKGKPEGKETGEEDGEKIEEKVYEVKSQ